MRIRSPRALVLVAAFTITSPAYVSAQAVPDCESLSGNVIYGVGGSAQTPLFGQLGSRLRNTADPEDQLTIVYAQPGACFAMAAFDPEVTPGTGSRAITGTAFYWDAGSNTNRTCNLPAGGVQPDFGSMQQYADFCPGVDALYDGLGDFTGPIGTVNVIVPTESSQTSISSEALYFLYKFGQEAGVEPWTDNNYIVHRNGTSAVQLQILEAAGLLDSSPEIAFGWDAGNNPATVMAVANGITPLATTPNKEATIGFVSGENAEANRDKLRTLAYQHVGQECAYWPDSSATAFDKLNVRTGRYYLWGALHLFAPVNGSGEVVNPDVARLVGYFDGSLEPPPELPILDVYIDNYNVPKCAMQVERDRDLGPISSYQPDEPCGCYFDFRSTGRTSCEECDIDDDCPDSDPVCRFGYCEVQ